MSGWTYEKAGVDIDRKSEAIEALVGRLGYRREGVGQMARIPGLFASLVDFGDRYMTLATDGVGTKLLVAEALGKWDTVGIDCIAMNVNDTICVGAEPVSFVDYIAIDRPDPEVTEQIGVGLQKGAELSDMEIVGGEIAVLPEIVKGVDLSGTCMGMVPKDDVVTGEECAAGDAIVGLRSSGVHSNGLTLARKVLFEAGNLDVRDHVRNSSRSVGEELLEPTEIYVRQVLEIARGHEVHGLVDITGGGLRNILRMRKGLRYVIDDPFEPAPVFGMMQDIGEISTEEMYQTFNMSMGFAIVAPEAEAEEIVRRYPNAKRVGRVEEGSGVLLEPEGVLYDHYRPSFAYSAPQTHPSAVHVSRENPPGVTSKCIRGMAITSFGTPCGPIPKSSVTLLPPPTIPASSSNDILRAGSGRDVVSTTSPSCGGNPLPGYGKQLKRPASAISRKFLPLPPMLVVPATHSAISRGVRASSGMGNPNSARPMSYALAKSPARAMTRLWGSRKFWSYEL